NHLIVVLEAVMKSFGILDGESPAQTEIGCEGGSGIAQQCHPSFAPARNRRTIVDWGPHELLRNDVSNHFGNGTGPVRKQAEQVIPDPIAAAPVGSRRIDRNIPSHAGSQRTCSEPQTVSPPFHFFMGTYHGVAPIRDEAPLDIASVAGRPIVDDLFANHGVETVTPDECIALDRIAIGEMAGDLLWRLLEMRKGVA